MMPVFLVELHTRSFAEIFKRAGSNQGVVLGAYNTLEKAKTQIVRIINSEGNGAYVERDVSYCSRQIVTTFEFLSKYGGGSLYTLCVSSYEVNKPIEGLQS